MNLTLQAFGGMLPRRDRQKLPPAGAELAENCDLLSGDLRALRGLTQLQGVDATGMRAAFRIPAALRGDITDPPPTAEISEHDLWYTFAEEFTHFVKGPLINDKYNRWYYSQPDQYVHYQSVSRIVNGEPPLVLGVPRPEKQGVLTPNTTPIALPFATFPGGLTVNIIEEVPWARTLLAEGGISVYTWEVTAGALPNGIELEETTGVMGGIPTTPGTFNATIHVFDSDSPANEASYAFTFNIAASNLPASGSEPTLPQFFDPGTGTYVTPGARVGEYFVWQPQYSGGGKDPNDENYPNIASEPEYTFDILSGVLPQGIVLDEDTGAISGTPTIAGTYTFTLQIEDQYYKKATRSYQIVVGADPLTEVVGSDLTVTRCYVYTFVSAANEEGPPSEPICGEGADDDFWTLCGMQTAPPEPYATDSLITKKRVYRTITGQSGGSFFFVDEIPIDQDCYKDEVTTDDVSLNKQLESDSWEPPPKGLIGLIRHPNGFLVGFLPPFDIYFSEPYRPHAWPPEYVLSTEGAISALGIFGTSIGVPTNAHPYVCSGSNPTNMSFIKTNISEPCLSRYGVVSTEAGVVYPSANGLVMLSPSGVQVITKQLMTRGEWNTRYHPDRLRGVQFGFEFYGVEFEDANSTFVQQGFILSPQESLTIFTETNMALQRDMVSLQTDAYNGQVYSIVNGRIWWWANWSARPELYRWRTAEFVTPKPVNFGAYRIDFDPVISYEGQAGADAVTELDTYLAWNADRLAAGPLDPLNSYALNETLVVDDSAFSVQFPQNRAPLGGSSLFDTFSLGAAYVEVLLYTDGKLRYRKTLFEPGRYRLPLGYKADLWQVEFRGNANLHHFKMAETGLELAGV